LIALYLVAYALGARFRPADLDRIAAHTEAALRLAGPVAGQAIRYRFMNHAVVVGRGLNYSNAFEFALKMMETSYVVAERFSSADFLHGPIAMVESAFPVFLFTPSGVTWPTMNEMAARLSAAGAEVFLFTDRSSPGAAQAKGRRITIPARLGHKGPLPEDIFTPIPYIVPAQLFAEALAREKGLDPDRPRMLTKVTQTL
jgi:glucosamine--fructose-6-phosphate aminotransferase (isomerizing)